MRALLKHEWRLTSKLLGIIFGAATLAILGSSIFMWLNIGFWREIATGISFLIIFAFFTGVAIFLVVHYYKTMNGEQGYFTHVIPIRGRTIYFAKIIHAAVVSFAALALAAILTYYLAIIEPLRNNKPLPSVWRGLATGYEEMGPGMAWFIISTFLVGSLLSIVSYTFAITIGSESRLAPLGLGGPVLVAIGYYIVQQIVTLTSMLVVPLGIKFTNQDCSVGDCPRLDSHFVFESMWTAMGPYFGTDTEPAQVVIGVGWIPALLIMGVLMIWWTINSIENRTSLH